VKKRFIQISGVPAIPLIVGEKAVIFHNSGYTRTGKVLSMCCSPMGSSLVITEDSVYWITPGKDPEIAQNAASALCA